MGEASGVGAITESVGSCNKGEGPCTFPRMGEVLSFEGGGEGVCVREGELRVLPPFRE